MTTQEGNKLIAEFMGLSTSLLHGELCYADWDGMHGVKYHSSWDWLMPVIDKIEGLGFEVTLQIHQCQVFQKDKPYPDNWIIDADFKRTKLENAWGGVTAFIQWYNENKLK